MTRVELLRSDDPAWDGCLAAVRRDVFHTAGYHRCAEASGEGTAYLAVVGDRDRGMAWPYLLRRVAEVPGLDGSDATDVTSVYGYPGPLAWGCATGDAFIASAWEAIRGVWRDQRAVAAFTRFHPLLGNAEMLAAVDGARGNPAADAPGVAREGVVPAGSTVSIDCTLDDRTVYGQYRTDLRQRIGRARRAGLLTTVDEDWRELPAFVRLYHETMERNQAERYYYFDEDALRRLRDELAGHAHLFVTRRDDTVAAAGIYTEFDGIVQKYLEGTAVALHTLSPGKLQTDDARRWARARGCSVVHLGGGRGGREDSLFYAKSRFSPRRHPFHVGRWILDGAAYDELVRARARGRSGRVATSYFPAYRAPAGDDTLVESSSPCS